MKDTSLQKIFSKIGVLSLFIFTILSVGCTKASLDDAEKAEAEQKKRGQRRFIRAVGEYWGFPCVQFRYR